MSKSLAQLRRESDRDEFVDHAMTECINAWLQQFGIEGVDLYTEIGPIHVLAHHARWTWDFVVDRPLCFGEPPARAAQTLVYTTGFEDIYPVWQARVQIDWALRTADNHTFGTSLRQDVTRNAEGVYHLGEVR
jgi:hypothetical protein